MSSTQADEMDAVNKDKIKQISPCNDSEVCSQEARNISNIRQSKTTTRMVIDEDLYRYIFGDSSDEEQEFYGFEEEDLGLKEFRSVISPRKLKLQEDFYLPLFLSHRKRKRCLNNEKFYGEEKITELYSAPNNEMIPKSDQTRGSDLKKCLDIDTKNISFPVSSEFLQEPSNPYAKRYKSYRKSRSRSPVAYSSGNEKIDTNFQESLTSQDSSIECQSSDVASEIYKNINTTTISKDNVSLSSESKKGNDLKLRIQYQVNTRPRRSVQMAENKDFVYDGNLTSNKKPRHLSSPVITGAKIVKEDVQHEAVNSECDTDSEVTIESQECNEVSDVKVKVSQTSKRKKRFKNFRSSKEGYPRALFGDMISSDTNASPNCSHTSETIASSGFEKMKDNSKGNGELKNDDELPSHANGQFISDKTKSNLLVESKTNDIADKSSLLHQKKTDMFDQTLTPENECSREETVMLKTHAPQMSETESDNMERKKDVKKSSSKTMTIPECTSSFESRNALGEGQKRVMSKAKSINLTDTWFSASSLSRKAKNRVLKKKSMYDESSNDEPELVNSDISSSAEKINFLENVTDISMQHRTSAFSKRRRLKNVTYTETDDNCAVYDQSINESKLRDSDRTMRKEVPILNHVDCKCSNSLTVDGSNENVSGLKGKVNTECPGCKNIMQEYTGKRDSHLHSLPQSIERKDHSENQVCNIDNEDLHADLYSDCKLTSIVDMTDTEGLKTAVSKEIFTNSFATENRPTNVRKREQEITSSKDKSSNTIVSEQSTTPRCQQNRFSRKDSRRIFDDKAVSEVSFSKPVHMILPDAGIEQEINAVRNEKNNENSDVNQQSACSVPEAKEKKSSRSIIKGDMKINKGTKSGRSFIIRTAVDDPAKQITLMDKSNKSNSLVDQVKKKDFVIGGDDISKTSDSDDRKGNLNENSNHGHNSDLQERRQDSQLYKGRKVKRKIYTVIRKIRRTEVNADGKKVTKIIKQIVKKVCPIVYDEDGNEIIKESDVLQKPNVNTDTISMQPNSSVHHSKDHSDKSIAEDLKLKNPSNQRCGKCIGCSRRDDCNACESCRRKKQSCNEANDVNIHCSKKMCQYMQSVKTQKLSPGRKLSNKVTKESDEDEKKQSIVASSKTLSTVNNANLAQKAIAVPQKSGIKIDKKKTKSKNVKNILKEEERKDMVYSPGFKLRSTVNDAMKVTPARVLKQVQYSGLEPTIKLPWSEKENEHAAYDSGQFFCVTTPITIRAKDICFHCGSGGYLKMLYCIECSEAYHDFCIDIDPLDEKNWLCDHCKKCNVCGLKDNLLMCDHCHDCYHAECLGPNYHKYTEGDDELWVCGKCVKCTKCGKRTPGKRKESKWMKNFTVCEECERRLRRGQYCLVCENVYSENDYETKMMYCTICKKWIHMECEGLNTDEYECLAELPDNIPYICKKCHHEDTLPTWYQEVREEINAGFEKIYYDFLASSNYKIIRKHVSEAAMGISIIKLENVFGYVQQNKFKTVADFVAAFENYLEDLSLVISEVLPSIIVTDMRTSLYKQLKSLFPWTEKINEKLNEAKSCKTTEKKGTKVPSYAVPTIFLDHTYNKNINENNRKGKENNESKANLAEIVDQKQTNNADTMIHALKESSTNNLDENIFDKLVCYEPSIKSSETLDEKFHHTIEINPAISGTTTGSNGKSENNSSHFDVKVTEEKIDLKRTECSSVLVSNSDSNAVLKLDNDDKNKDYEQSNIDDDVLQDDDSITTEATIRTAKHNDDRRCLLCSQYGDESQNEAGRILSAGVNEWVHVNCALWSAEVYESDSGLLQNVHAAIARGQKLRCSLCQQWGATVGCCASNCPSNYHFMCARNDNILFQDNKIVYCEKHKQKSKNQALLGDDGFAVLRPVLVDMSKVLGQKKFSVGRDPDSVIIYSGSLTVHRLGRLSESSDGTQNLTPVGFRATRIFWDAKDCRRRCRYHISIEEKQQINNTQEDKKELTNDFMGGSTVCHDVNSSKIKQKRKLLENVSPISNKRKKIEYKEKNTRNCSDNATAPNPSCSEKYHYTNASINKPSSLLQYVVSCNRPDNQENDGTLESDLPVDTVISNPLITTQPDGNGKRITAISLCQSIATSTLVTEGEKERNAMSTAHTDLSSSILNRPSLIQPQLRSELYSNTLNIKNTNCGTFQEPKLGNLSSDIVSKLQKYLAKNPHMLNFVGNTSLNGINKSLAVSVASNMISSSTEKSQDSSSRIPCYALNVPEKYIKALSSHTTHAIEKGELTPNGILLENSSEYKSKNTILPHISHLVDELPKSSPPFSQTVKRSFEATNTLAEFKKEDNIKYTNAVKENKSENKKNKDCYLKRLQKLLAAQSEKRNSLLSVIIKNDEGLRIQGDSIESVWKTFICILNETRMDQKMSPILFSEQEGFDFFGLSKFPLVFLTEQLPGGHKCRNYKFQYHLPCLVDEDKELPVNQHGCARAEVYTRHSHGDMFSWLASPYRALPYLPEEPENESEIKSSSDLPLSMRFRQLKSNVKDHVGVYRSLIHGRGLFCKRKIELGEMVIEYAGSVIRGTLTDKRENYYDGKGYGCYMFRIDDMNVVDATLFGNEARFINHSCEPNCYSRIVSVDGKKHIIIFASRRILPGEELTYDYKFPFEEEKLPCHCGSKRCRKYLN